MSFQSDREAARHAVARRAWRAARAGFAAADAAGTLDPSDLESWGLAAFLTGEEAEADGARERAHHAYLDAGDGNGAARVAFWLGLALTMRGEPARGGGWFGRMRSSVGEAGFDATVWRGYELATEGMRALFSGDPARSRELLTEALAYADRFADPDLRVLAGNGHGQALLALAEVAAGMAELDEVLVLATTTDATPQVVGQVYCAVINICRNCMDLARSAEWTRVLTTWCEAQPDLVPYRGACMVHRSELMQLHGAWDDALDEVQSVIDRLAHVHRDLSAGSAYYQRGELHRLRGDFAAAEADYRQALAIGHDPQPGLALLRLAEGRADTALVAVRRALEESTPMSARVYLLDALTQIALALGDVTAARAAADDLGTAARSSDSQFLAATASAADGAVLLAEDRALRALPALRDALNAFVAMGAGYQAARCRVLVAAACRALGDADSADLELDAARTAFAELGAARDLALVGGRATAPKVPPAPGGLTKRELEILRLVATGAGNRAIAQQLFLSEKTVARHLANIFGKLAVSSRSAATAYAYDHRLV